MREETGLIIKPKTSEEAKELIWDVLIQGDSRYISAWDQEVLSVFLFDEAIILEKREIPDMPEPKEDDFYMMGNVQTTTKYIANILLKQNGFENNQIFFERTFMGGRTDVYAESENKIIAVECHSCRVSKIADYLSKDNTEVWVITLGSVPWDKNPVIERKEWFILKRGPNWSKAEEFKKKYWQHVCDTARPIINKLFDLDKSEP